LAASQEVHEVGLIIAFEVLTAVVMKSSVIWVVTLCVRLKSIDVSEQHVASTFKAE
jgi:hypothetical protein